MQQTSGCPARRSGSARLARQLLVFAMAVAGCSAAATEQERAAVVPGAPSEERAAATPDVSFYESIVAAPDREDADRALDAGRMPAKMLEFFGITPGMRVAEISAGGGYTAELLARSVGESGVVYGHNAPFVLRRFAEGPWSSRLGKPVMSRVVRVDREFDDPLPAEAKNLDAVLMVLFYHDTVWQGADRAKMNRAIFDALKPGGIYGVVDHSAREGRGLEDVETLHRIEESVVRREIEAAGFRLAAESDLLRNPADKRDWNASPRTAGERRGTSDRFVLKFVKPAAPAPVAGRSSAVFGAIGGRGISPGGR